MYVLCASCSELFDAHQSVKTASTGWLCPACAAKAGPYVSNSRFKAKLEKKLGQKIDVWTLKHGECDYEGAASVGPYNDLGHWQGYAESRSQAYRQVLERLAAREL